MVDAAVTEEVYNAVIKAVGGTGIVVLALLGILGRIWVSRITNKETREREAQIVSLKADIDRQAAELKAKQELAHSEMKAELDTAVQRTIFVDKVRFEHEYKIYQTAWERLFALRQVILELRPMMDYVDPTEEREDRMRRRLAAVTGPFNDYSHLIETSRPFYPPEVYASLVAVRSHCQDELIGYEYTERPRKEYWAEARRSQADLLKLIDEACEAIRARITDVRVI